jgi:hypothetical protein
MLPSLAHRPGGADAHLAQATESHVGIAYAEVSRREPVSDGFNDKIDIAFDRLGAGLP